jgi:hypothetical protein
MPIVLKRVTLLSSGEFSDILIALTSSARSWPAGPAQRALQLRDRLFDEVGILVEETKVGLRAA